jgi:hypothetical protein
VRSAVLAIVEPHIAHGDVEKESGIANHREVLVVARGSSDFAQALESRGWQMSSLVAVTDAPSRPSGTTGSQVGACILDNVLVPTAEPDQVLANAYANLRPHGRLVVILGPTAGDTGSVATLRGRNQRGGFPGESLPALLFQEGFERPRFYTYGSTTIATAYRSDLLPPSQRPHRLSVIMPVFNERQTFRKAMDTLLGKSIPGMEINIIVVESNSTDGTRDDVLEYSDHPRVTTILEDRPQGKGHAVRVGIAEARGDFLIIQDADLEYDIDDYDSLLEPLRQYEVGFVLGMRTNPDGSWGMRQFGERNFVSRVMNLGHIFFLMLFNVVYGQRLHDPFTMYKVMRRDCLYGLTFECNRFDFDWELTAKLIRAGYVPKELPASYESRSFTDGKKVSFFGDPLTWIVACFKYRFVRLYR